MGMRRAWQSYNQCSKGIVENPHLQLTPIDKDGVFFGLGVFNLVLGILPPRVLRIVKLLGFGGDRDEGLKQLHMCMEACGVRSVLAVVALLAYHVLVPSFFSLPQAMSYHIEQAEGILQKSMLEYPGSAFLTFLQGRHERLKQNLPGSLETLTRSLNVVRPHPVPARRCLLRNQDENWQKPVIDHRHQERFTGRSSNGWLR